MTSSRIIILCFAGIIEMQAVVKDVSVLIFQPLALSSACTVWGWSYPWAIPTTIVALPQLPAGGPFDHPSQRSRRHLDFLVSLQEEKEMRNGHGCCRGNCHRFLVFRFLPIFYCGHPPARSKPNDILWDLRFIFLQRVCLAGPTKLDLFVLTEKKRCACR